MLQVNSHAAWPRLILGWILALSLTLASASCLPSGSGPIKLPANAPLSRGLGWAVVKDAYARLKAKPDESSSDLDNLRRGDVFRLDAREFGPTVTDASGRAHTSLWYGLTADGHEGWVSDAELDVYSSETQAEKASAELK